MINEYNYHLSKDVLYFTGIDYCLLGNGYIQAIIQVGDKFVQSRGATALKRGNGLLLFLISPDKARAQEEWLTFHHQRGPEPTSIIICQQNKDVIDLYQCDNEQILSGSAKYGLDFNKGIPTFWIRYPAEYRFSKDGISSALVGQGRIPPESKKDRERSFLQVEERFFAPIGYSALIREVRVKNLSNRLEKVGIFSTLASNKNFLPDAHYLPNEDIAICGNYNGGKEFLGLGSFEISKGHAIAEYPKALEGVEEGRLSRNNTGNGSNILRNPSDGVHLAMGYRRDSLVPGEETSFILLYLYGESEDQILEELTKIRKDGYRHIKKVTRKYYQKETTLLQPGDKKLEKLYLSARAGIRAAVSSASFKGRMNSGIWCYDSEWFRDSMMVILGALNSGQFEIAKQMLSYAFTYLVDELGRCLAGQGGDFSGAKNDYQIDMNGMALYAIWNYWVYTGDFSLIEKYWKKICRIAEYPLKDIYQSEDTPMLHSIRDMWERGEDYGLGDGYEIIHQMWTYLGLNAASEMADSIGDKAKAKKWESLARKNWHAVLNDPKYRLIHDNHFIKRKFLDGRAQEIAIPRRNYREFKQALLEPDSGEVLPIAFNLPGVSEKLAGATIEHVDKLWNQDGLWRFGGHGRYNVSSDPNSNAVGGDLGSPVPLGVPASGPWPLASVFVTRACLEAGDFSRARRTIDWVIKLGEPTFTWFENIDYAAKGKEDSTWYCGGIVPWLVYGEVPILMVYNFFGFRPKKDTIEIEPHLFPEIKKVKANIRYKRGWIKLEIINGRKCSQVFVNGRRWGNYNEKGTVIPSLNEGGEVRMIFKG